MIALAHVAHVVVEALLFVFVLHLNGRVTDLEVGGSRERQRHLHHFMALLQRVEKLEAKR